jgi:hypothetical protein
MAVDEGFGGPPGVVLAGAGKNQSDTASTEPAFADGETVAANRDRPLKQILQAARLDPECKDEAEMARLWLFGRQTRRRRTELSLRRSNNGVAHLGFRHVVEPGMQQREEHGQPRVDGNCFPPRADQSFTVGGDSSRRLGCQIRKIGDWSRYNRFLEN